jgi:hypothetical protein
MKNTFSFTLIEHSETTTEVLFPEKYKELIETILDSYDFEWEENSSRSLFIHEKFEDVFDDLTDFEVDEEETVLLTEEDEGFYVTELDDVYEILYSETIDTSLLEGTPKRTVAVRGGKRKVLFKCGPGQMKVGRSCRRRPTAQLNKMKRRARISARKARKKRRLANRKRKLSLKRRAVLVRKKPHK